MTSQTYFELSTEDKIDALEAAASALGRPADLLEKDIWVVWALNALFDNPVGDHLVFKGGTALSKVYKAINRFSEDLGVSGLLKIVKFRTNRFVLVLRILKILKK